MSPVKEVVLFRLNEGVDETVFLADAKATFDLLASYEGYISRELSVSDDGLWVDTVLWSDMDTALQAAENIMKSEIGQAFGQHINPDSIQMSHVRARLDSEASKG